MSESKTNRRAATTTQIPATSRTKSKASSVDRLASELAGLQIADKKGKQRQQRNAVPELSPEANRVQAMKTVNTVSQALSKFLQAGLKCSRQARSTSASEVRSCADTATRALRVLRTLDEQNLDVERAASSVVGKLVSMEFYEQALALLSDIHRRLYTLIQPELAYPQVSTGYLHLLSIPLPNDDSTLDGPRLAILSTYFLHAITAIINSNPTVPDFVRAMAASSFLHWAPTFSRIGDIKHMTTILTRVYSLMVKSPLSSASPKESFTLRCYGLTCLLYSSADTITPDAFWDQALKYTGSLLKSAGTKDEIVEITLRSFEELITKVEATSIAHQFMSCQQFIAFCECWTGLAKRVGRLDVMRRIGVLVTIAGRSPSSSPAPSAPETPVAKVHRPTSARVALASLCTLISQAQVTLEDPTRDTGASVKLVDQLVGELTKVAYLWRPMETTNEGGSKDAEAVAKTQRMFERIRRHSVKMFEDQTLDRSLCMSLRKLHETIIDVIEPSLSEKGTSETYTQLLDSLFVLSRTTLDVRNAHTHGASFDYLERAVTILRLDDKADNTKDVDKPNYLRCISGAFHNLAGTLYNAERYGATIRFLTRACELGALALSSRRNTATLPENSEKDSQAWRQLDEQIYRRWELLGACHSKIGDHKLAYTAFTESITAFPFADTTVDVKHGVDFNASPSLKQLGALIDRVTYMGTCDLFLPPSRVSLLHAFDKEVPLPPRWLGVLVEKQLNALVGSQWKESVPPVVRQLLRDLLVVYEAERYPIRRAKVYIRCLETAYLDHALFSECDLENYLHVVQAVQELVSRQDLGEDAPLSHCQGILLASAHAWAALHAHRAATDTQIVDITNHANEACNTLSMVVMPSSSRPSLAGIRQSTMVVARRVSSPKVFRKMPSPKAPRKAPPKRTVVRKPPASRANIKQPNNVAAAEPVTPKNRVVQLPQASTALPNSANTSTDELERLLEVFHATTTMLGLVGLTLTKIRTLVAIRKVTDGQSSERLGNSYVSASVDLALEYLNLGKLKKATSIHKQILNTIQHGTVSTPTRIRFLLQYAQTLAYGESLPLSVDAYNQASLLSEELPKDERGLNTSQRIQRRVDQLETAAMAARTHASIQFVQSNIPATIDSLLQSLRLFNRALETMSRLTMQPSQEATEGNPFEKPSSNTSSHEDALAAAVKPSLPNSSPKIPAILSGREWCVADGLFQTFFDIVGVYFTRGSPREAQYFAEQALDLAESLNAPVVISRAQARVGEIQIHQGQLLEGQTRLAKAAELLIQTQCTDVVNIDRLHAEWNLRASQPEDAKHLYERARTALRDLEQSYGAYEAGPRRSSLSAASSRELLVPELLANVLSQYIWLTRDDECIDERSSLLDAFLCLPPSRNTSALQASLIAKLAMHTAFGRFGMDMFLSSLTESTIAIPIGMSCQDNRSSPAPSQEVLTLLDKASSSYWQELGLITAQGEVPKVRSAAVSLALVHALKTSLGKCGRETSTLLINLLDISNAITLHREMLEASRHKCEPLRPINDMQWPSVTPSQTPADSSSLLPPKFLLGNTDLEDDDMRLDQLNKEYWDYVRKHYEPTTLDPGALSTSQLSQLPSNWTVVHVCITDDRNSLFITRQFCGPDQPEPLIFCVPLKHRREADGEENEEHLSFEDALAEFAEIIRLSDEGTRSATRINADDMAVREQWWKERRELDTRMKDLLANIEFCWLGAFKTILSRRSKMGPELLKDLRLQFDRVFHNGLHLQEKGKPRSKGKKPKNAAKSPGLFHLDDVLLECFSSLSPKCRDEELEDLVYFVLDLYQLHGVPVATAEVDVTQVAVDLRGVLEDHSQRLARSTKSQGSSLNDDEHIFLVLDKNVQGLPWESIPILRGRSVSRIPNTKFLLDRVHYANTLRPDDTIAGGGCSRTFVNPRKTYYMLNPSGDLKKSEGRFRDWLDGMQQSVGWDGIAGHAPSEQQFLNALEQNDLFIYFGHGGGEQYARSHKIRQLSRCSAVMLWGCSSGALKDMGDYDRIGTPYNYILAGSPCLVANLWDVTDRDIDKFSQEVFDQLKLNSASVKAWDGRNPQATSVVKAVAGAREVCKLKYLTGAAAVVYGVPYYL